MRVPRSNRTFVKSVQSVAERFPLKFTFSYALKSPMHDSALIFFPVSESLKGKVPRCAAARFVAHYGYALLV